MNGFFHRLHRCKKTTTKKGETTKIGIKRKKNYFFPPISQAGKINQKSVSHQITEKIRRKSTKKKKKSMII